MSDEQIDAVVAKLLKQYHGYEGIAREVYTDEVESRMSAFKSGLLSAVRVMAPGPDPCNHSEVFKQIFVRFNRAVLEAKREIASPEATEG